MSVLLRPEQEEVFAESILDPVLFARNLLQTDLWGVQEEILRAAVRHSRIAVKAAHSTGKTMTAACLALWWVARHPEAIVVTTAPSATQLEKILWGEIHGLLQKSRYPFPDPLMTDLKFGPKRYLTGFTTSVTANIGATRFQGFHSPHLLYIVDEAPGIAPEIFDAILGGMAGGSARLVLLGNPTITSGYFYDCFAKSRSDWKTITISAFDGPNLSGLTIDDLLAMAEDELDANPRPYLTTKRWTRERYEEWGAGHPLYQSRVLGQFPTQSAEALLSLEWLETAKDRKLSIPGAPVRAGLDVAGPGEDETVLTIRRGPQLVSQKVWPDADPRGEVVAALTPYRERGELETVNVDSIAIGWGMYCHLLDLGFPAVAVNVGLPARDNEKFANLKAELYWGLRLRAQAGDLSGMLDDKTIGQLAGIRYKPNSRGQIQIESKDDARKRGVKSPDRAESVMLAFAEMGTAGAIYARSFSRNDDELIFDLASMSPGFGNCGSYQQRVIAVGWGAAVPFAALEIMDDGKTVWILREYWIDPARETEPRTDAAYAADIFSFAAGNDPLNPDAAPVIRSRPTDARMVVRESRDTDTFHLEARNRGLWVTPVEDEMLRGIELVGSLFERRMVRVNYTCRNFIREHRAYAWNRAKAAQGTQEPIPNHPTVEAFRLFGLACVDQWRLLYAPRAK